MTEEFDLSKEELDNQHLHSGVGGLYQKEKVKEFIRLLKDDFYLIAKNRVPNKINEISYHQAIKRIDKLAGDKLK